MTYQRSTILVVIAIVAAVILVTLAYSQQQQSASDAHDAATAQAVAEANAATAVANAEIAADKQTDAESTRAAAESNAATAAADVAIAASKIAEAGSSEGTAIANYSAAATAQAIAESDAASSRATTTRSADIMATIYAELDAERATAVANYEALATLSTQPTPGLTPTETATVWTSGPAGEGPVAFAMLMYSPTCPHCKNLMENTLPPILEEFGDQLVVLYVNVTTSSGYALAQAAYQAFDIPEDQHVVPMMIVGTTVLVGGGGISTQLPDIVRTGLAAGGIPLPAVPGLQEAYEQALTGEAQPQAHPEVATPTPTPALS